MARGSWLHEGIDPLPPAQADKALDEQVIALAGGDAIFKGRRVLDLGPCYGVEAKRYAHRAATYVAYDFDELVIEWVRRQTDLALGIVGDFRQLPFLGQSFDTVLDIGSFDNISEHPADLYQAYREAVRVLTPGGTFITCYGNAFVLGTKGLPGETNTRPDQMHTWLVQALGLCVTHRGNEEQARAFMVAVK